MPPDQPAGYDQWSSYDTLGNLTSKAGVSYSYGSNGNGTGAGPHQARTAGGQAYTYDAVGNLVSGGGRTYSWQADNLPASISSGGATETYTYDADGERLTRTAGGVTTVYVGGLYEEDLPTGVTRALYQFNGQIIAQRSSDASGLIYLHGDHLGSVSLATNASGAVVNRQEFDPWGSIRSGGISQTSLNYTGQRRDGTGLLYYHARYYDPALSRFISADTIVPDSGALTLWPSDTTAAPLFAQANAPGPQNPQELNRYAYVNNNPVRHTDSTGHLIDTLLDVGFIAYGIYDIAANGYTAEKGLALAADVGSALLPGVTGGGMAVRALAHADDVATVVTKADNAADAAKVIAKTGCSFSADTPVATADGAVPIGAIEVGEQVLAYDEATGTTGSYTVTAVLVHADPVITYLTIAGEEVATTPEHPFYTRERTWVEAGSLWVGAQVRRADGSYGVVQAIRVEARPHIMYNLTVATAHTFFVGDQQWLVHNSCGKPIVVEHPSKRAARRAAEREAGMGKHGSREVLEPEEFNPGSRPPSGDPGKRQRVRSPETGRIVHHDPWGHKWPDGSTIPPHYGVDYPRGRPTTHHTYPSKHDPRKNR